VARGKAARAADKKKKAALAANGRAVQVDPIKPTLKPPGTKRLRLKYDEPLSNFAFKINLRRYTKAGCPTWTTSTMRTRRTCSKSR